jgi:hypothetical protein
MDTKSKKYVLVRMQEGGSLFVLGRMMFEEMRGLGEPFDGSEIVAEADEMLSLMQFKQLTKEGD